MNAHPADAPGRTAGARPDLLERRTYPGPLADEPHAHTYLLITTYRNPGDGLGSPADAKSGADRSASQRRVQPRAEAGVYSCR